MDKNNKIDKGGSSWTIEKLARFQKNIRNLTKFQDLKNSAEYKKSIINLVKFPIFARSSFLNSAVRLVFI